MNFSKEKMLPSITEGKWPEHMNIIKECGLLEASCVLCSNKPSMLHYICHFDPALCAVERFYATCPTAVFQMNSLGRFPLHIAVNNNASANVVNFLVSHNPSAVLSKDIHGRYPLHLAFTNFSTNKNQRNEKEPYPKPNNDTKRLALIVNCLCEVAPGTVIAEDSRGMNPLEYAIEKEIDIRIIRKLQEVAGLAHKRKLNSTSLSRKNNIAPIAA